MKKISNATMANANRKGWTMAPPAMAMIKQDYACNHHNMSFPPSLAWLLCARIPAASAVNLKEARH